MVNEEFSYYLILLGGTGARCGEIFIHMCANGYFSGDKVNILYIDSDLDNGNAKAMRELYTTYKTCRQQYRIIESPIPCFFKTEIDLKETNPVQGLNYFSDLIYQGGVNSEAGQATKAFMRTLYSDEEYEMKISDGFFARPNVGSSVFAANTEEMLKWLLNKINNTDKKVKIFMIGSIFGGTGASSFPTISKYLKKKLYGESDDRLIGNKLKIGGSMLLPYFSFLKEDDAQEEGEGIKIEAKKFTSKTKSALEYYRDIETDPNRKVFDALYILGHDQNSIRGNYSTYGSKQENLPHIVEFYSAMSAVTFFEKNNMNEGKFFAVIPPDKIEWSRMYKSTKCFFSFLIMMRFSIVMKSLILEELFEQDNGQWKRKKHISDIPWYHDFIYGRSKLAGFDIENLGSKFYSISDYCDKYITWFAELMIKNIKKRKAPHELETTYHEKVENDGEEDDDLIDYLILFSNELLMKQYENVLIEKGEPEDYSKEDREGRRQQNIEFIRKNADKLSDKRIYDGEEKYDITFEQIWSRICEMGFDSIVEDNIVKNVTKVFPKTIDEGVRNLINAIYVACMI